VTAGAVWDVLIDLRPGSHTYLKHVGIRLDAHERAMAYVPEGFEHGFLTLADDTEVAYQMSAFYAPAAARGARWDDPSFGIDWPEPVTVVSERDATYPDFTPGQAGVLA
jgi:dTDP-4-dehydrorhamnose 3,5-epimerase